jgi:hypothetical protein
LSQLIASSEPAVRQVEAAASFPVCCVNPSGVTIGMMSTALRAAVLVVMAAASLRAQPDPETLRTRDAAVQAFRDSPSLGRFSDAGLAITGASGWRAFDGPSPSRPPRNRDFDAMKARLADGIVVSTSVLPSPSSSFDLPPERIMAMLPAVRPSFFRRDEALFAIALRPFKLIDDDVITLIDALSAVNRVTMRVRVAEPMSFGNNGPRGAWDVGAVEARFEREAPVHGVTPGGQATGYTVRSIRAPIGSQRCGLKEGTVIGTRVNAGWASSVVAWIGKPAPGNAIVTSRAMGGTDVHDKLVTESIDLNRDGVPDFSTWAGIDRSEIVDDVDIPWKAVFVNLDGEWTLGSYRAEPDCT